MKYDNYIFPLFHFYLQWRKPSFARGKHKITTRTVIISLFFVTLNYAETMMTLHNDYTENKSKPSHFHHTMVMYNNDSVDNWTYIFNNMSVSVILTTKVKCGDNHS